MPTNAVCLDVLQDVFYLFEFNEVNVLACRPLSQPLISSYNPLITYVPTFLCKFKVIEIFKLFGVLMALPVVPLSNVVHFVGNPFSLELG